MCEHLPLPPEPPNDAYVVAGEPPEEIVYRRCDREDPEDPARWWPLVGEEADPGTWWGVNHREVVNTDTGGVRYDRLPIERLWRTGEETEPVGGHQVVVSTGRCVCHGTLFAPTELARLRAGSGDE